jgi:hypothetical protein
MRVQYGHSSLWQLVRPSTNILLLINLLSTTVRVRSRRRALLVGAIATV